MSVVAELPKWDVSCYFPGVGSKELSDEMSAIKAEAFRLEALFDEHAGGEDSSGFAEVLVAFNALSDRAKLVRSFIHSFVSTDSKDEVALARQSEMQPVAILMNKLVTRLTAWVGRMQLEELIESSEVARSHEFAIRRMAVLSEHQMSEDLEALASDLSDSGTSAWARLYGNFSSQVSVPFRGEDLPMAAVRNLAYDSSADVRREAYAAELAAWERNELAIAAAMNAIKYESNLLAKRRGWGSVLDEAVFATNIDGDTLSAMMEAAHDAFPAFRRYLRAKSRRLGNTDGLPWSDLFAPVGAEGGWTYEKAMSFVEEGFRAYSDAMGDLAARSFAEDWIDVAPRAGKRDGAFCMGTRGDESRILMNFKESFGSVATLAHELGHAYHNVCLADRTAVQSQTPMTLAETASIFCETVIKRRAIASTSGGERLAILEASLQGSCQTVVDITSRFLFERGVYERRAERELSAREFCGLMSDAQKETYGDGLSSWHPYMWAVKPHYYAWRPFYNYPYMFGLLFSLGLYAVYETEPKGFHARYDDLLSSTGLADAATLADRFGIDTRRKEFWAASLRVVEGDVALFEGEAGV
jgi:pepF/M3 family oligoendopeptidase